ncbi:MAG: copper chaperone PCu(A)C [Rhizobiales bacterium]|nr:copper chaperone PCu(A)C [Hyphomicrobiales bacterium]
MIKIIFTLIIAIFSLTSIANASSSNDIKINNAWLRVAPNKVAVAFFTIENSTDKTIQILSAKTKHAKRTELHNHIMNNGIMKMRQVKLVEVKANDTVKFNPHGYHLMMFNLDIDAFKPGKQVEIIFTFDNDTEQKAMFRVIAFGMKKPKNMKTDHSKMPIKK